MEQLRLTVKCPSALVSEYADVKDSLGGFTDTVLLVCFTDTNVVDTGKLRRKGPRCSCP